MTRQDEEWIKSIVENAITQAVMAMIDQMANSIQNHEKNCPNVSKARYMLAGAIMAFAAGAGGVAASPIVQMILGKT